MKFNVVYNKNISEYQSALDYIEKVLIEKKIDYDQLDNTKFLKLRKQSVDFLKSAIQE